MEAQTCTWVIVAVLKRECTEIIQAYSDTFSPTLLQFRQICIALRVRKTDSAVSEIRKQKALFKSPVPSWLFPEFIKDTYYVIACFDKI